LDAMQSARSQHSFLGIDQDGFTSIIRTTGNSVGHVVLRGGRLRPNYDADSIAEAESRLLQVGLPPVLMVDCSHANSGKQHSRQEEVWRSIIEQRVAGTKTIIGAMVESYLEEGNQPLPAKATELRYGVSVTDACVSWDTTERMLRGAAEMLAKSAYPIAVSK
jgi:3-deoxy-7-phosphoheptulonate synthase